MSNEIIKCRQYDIMRLDAKTGQMYFTTDTRSLYKDNGPTKEGRLRFNAIILHSEAERLNSIRPVIGKFYYVEQSNCLWLFDTRWVLKVGQTSLYNTYTAGKYASPVINTDTDISGANGDKIIDNNGLLGNGSVVVRDSNRINRCTINSNDTYNQIEMKSYLDDGFLFIPNAHLPYNDLSKSLGALHLTVEKKDTINTSGLDLNGIAHYYGTWNNYGNIYLIQQDINTFVDAIYVPNNEHEIIKHYITCSTINESGDTYKTNMIIRPMSETTAMIHIITINKENATSVVKNDMGELIFTNNGDLINNEMFECVRNIIKSDAYYYISQYKLEKYNETITIKQHRRTNVIEVEIGEKWCDDKSNITIETSKWIKNKVVTEQDLEKELQIIKNELNQLKQNQSN